MADQETLREIKRVLEMTSRIDERVKTIAESHEKMSDRFDKFLEQHALITERVTRLESSVFNIEKFGLKIISFEEEHKKTANRVTALEGTAPYALKIVNQSLEALNKLSERVNNVEKEQGNQTQKIKTWFDWIQWGGEWITKLAWIVLAAWILYQLKLTSVNIPTPM